MDTLAETVWEKSMIKVWSSSKMYDFQEVPNLMIPSKCSRSSGKVPASTQKQILVILLLHAAR